MTDERFLTPRLDVSWDEIGEAVERLGGTRMTADDEVVRWRLDGTVVRLFEESALHVDQLGVRGERCDEVANALARALPVYVPDDVPRLFDGSKGVRDLEYALGVLGALALPEPDGTLVDVLRRGLRHADPDVRHAALVAASVPAWSVVRMDVERLTLDDDDDVRAMAPLVLRALDGP